MEKYDIYFEGVKLNTNTPSMTKEKADNYIGIVQITYGYKPEKIKVKTKKIET